MEGEALFGGVLFGPPHNHKTLSYSLYICIYTAKYKVLMYLIWHPALLLIEQQNFLISNHLPSSVNKYDNLLFRNTFNVQYNFAVNFWRSKMTCTPHLNRVVGMCCVYVLHYYIEIHFCFFFSLFCCCCCLGETNIENERREKRINQAFPLQHFDIQ